MSLAMWKIGGTAGFSLVSPDERRAFADAWSRVGGRALEVGTFDGATAAEVAAANAGPLWCVDTFELAPAAVNNWLANQRPNMHLFVGSSDELAPVLPAGFFSVAFVDGGHDYASCRLDLASCLDLVRPSGRILIHDYSARCFAESIPVAASDVLLPAGWRLVETVGQSGTAIFEGPG